MPLILRVCCYLEPHAAGVFDQSPAVTECVDEEQPAATLLGRAAACQLGAADTRAGVANLAMDPATPVS